MSGPEFHSSSEESNELINLFGKHPRGVSARDVKSIVLSLPVEGLSGSALEELRDMGVGRMQSSLPQEERVLWAEVAIFCIRRKEVCGASDLLASSVDEARIRSYVIRNLDGRDLGPTWSLEELCGLVLDSIPYPFEEAKERASRWRSLSREEMLTLRRIKNLLGAVKDVGRLIQEKDEACEGVRMWLDLVPLLP
ncbi:hypothetical protein [Streptomyces carminius]|uniref:hypothetical protein n=1 Tax=Streptomyces carminius TaxID=2665496 RepID=UPI0011B6DD71|nr:hypothetical protein [Streptomyces carminius]